MCLNELAKLRRKLKTWRLSQGEDLNKALMPADALTGKMHYAD